MTPGKWFVLLGLPVPLLAAAIALYPRLLPRERYDRAEGARALAAPGKFVEVGGRTMHYVEQGEGPPVILLHGFFYHGFLWRETMTALAPRFHCYAIDLFGFGYSDRPAAPGEARYGYDLWQDQLGQFMDALKIERAHLVGQSLGGATIMAYAAKHPERANKLVLVCPAGIPNPAGGGGGPMTLPYLGEFLFNLPGDWLMRKVLCDFFMHDPARVTDAYLAEVVRPAEIRGSRAAALWIMRNVDLGGIEDRIRAFGALKKPSLLVWGKDDRAIPVANAERMREIVSPERVVLIDGAGHVPHQERPEVANPAILEFLTGEKATK